MIKIGILITTYNDYRIEEALHSLENQTYNNFKVIIVMDGCDENYKTWLKKIINNFSLQIKLLDKERIGRAKALNAGLRLLYTYDYVAILDSDDTFEPTKLEEQLQVMENDKRIVICATEFFSIIDDKIHHQKFKFPSFLIKLLFILFFPLCHSTILFNLKRIKNEFYNENYKCCIDYEYFTRIIKYGKVHIIKKPLVRRIIHKDNFFMKNITRKEYLKIKKRLQFKNAINLLIHPLFFINR